MGTSPAAELARIKVRYPAWSIRKIDHGPDSPPTYLATRASNGDEIKAETLGELDNALARKSASEVG
jgi:hypothetical protein